MQLKADLTLLKILCWGISIFNGKKWLNFKLKDLAFFDILVLEQSKVNINLPAKLGHIISYYIKVIYTDMPNRDLFYESKLQTFTRLLYCLDTIKFENKKLDLFNHLTS